MASDELAKKLARRNDVIDAAEEGREITNNNQPSLQVFNPYTEFKEFSRKEIQDKQKMFNRFVGADKKHIAFEELKRMMEVLGAPQTHLGLKAMIKEIDEDHDNRINFREFMLIFRKAAAGELAEDSGLYELYKHVQSVEVHEVGVGGAKNFFEAKVAEQSQSTKFEQEIREEQEERRKLEQEKKERRADFKAKANLFNQ